MHRPLGRYLLLLLLGSSPLSAQPWLEGEALRAMVSDRTAVCHHLERPSSGRTYYDPDGTMHGIRRGEARSGQWQVQGDTLCNDWGTGPVCSRYREDGLGGHYKFTLQGKMTVHIAPWLEGDRVDD